MIPRLKITYEKEIVVNLMNKLSLKNKQEVPRFEKIILKSQFLISKLERAQMPV